MRKFAVVVLAMALLMLCFFAPAMAFGPANNPHADVLPGAIQFETPGQVFHEFLLALARINLIMDAKSTGKGIMNNVNLIVDSLPDLLYFGQNAATFMDTPGWIYLSGEMTEGGTFANPMFPLEEGEHGAFYWFLIVFQVPPNQALAIANESPYGIYLGGHDVGWS